jgi:S1-C subfamily serine protease
MKARSFLVAILSLLVSVSLFCQLNINGYKYLVVLDSENDAYAVSSLIRKAASDSGMTVVTGPMAVEEKDLSATCLVGWSLTWWGSPQVGARITLNLVDAQTKQSIATAEDHGGWSFSREKNLAKAVREAWRKLHYNGFDEKALEQNLAKNPLPTRPIVHIDEAEIKTRTMKAPAEGIWADPDNRYTIAIIPDDERKYGDFIGVVLATNNPLWKKGEIKMELRETAAATVLVGNYYMGNKSRQGTTFIVENALMKFETKAPNGTAETMTMIKLFPKLDASNSNNPPSGATFTGTGFLLSTDGYFATNNHVIKDATEVTALFPGLGLEFRARVVLKDARNDLAILKLQDYSPDKTKLMQLPYVLHRSQAVSLGAKVSVIGFPLESMLGQNPKYTEGVISSKSGFDDDPRCFQISVPIQPGNSGSPLFDGNGGVVGVVVSSLNAGYLYAVTEGKALPQNVNYAVKADYLQDLIDMLPEPLPQAPKGDAPVPSPETLSKYILLIRAKH